MSTAMHTPGPWLIETTTKGFEVCTLHGVERQPTEDRLGQSWVYVRPASMVRNGEWHWPNETEQFANARLIAAAPELLEVLKRLRAASTSIRDDIESETVAALAEADAAIAKAEGQP